MTDVVTSQSNLPLSGKPVTRWNRVAREFDWVSRLIVGGIFIWSASAHLANPYYLLSTIYQYELTSATVGALVASYLPFLELVLAVCLLSNTCSKPAWAITSLLLLSFVYVQASALMRGLKISCGCFGPEINRPIDSASLTFTAALAVLAICACLAQRAARNQDQVVAT